MEDQSVAARAMLNWPNIVKLIFHYESQSKSTRPDNKYYQTLVHHYKSVLVLIRFQFFRYITCKCNGFLNKFESDNPFLPLLAGSLEDTLRDLMNIFVKPEILNIPNTPCHSRRYETIALWMVLSTFS